MPHFASDGSAVNGGIPQAGNLTLHLTKFRVDFAALVPEPTSKGVCLLDYVSAITVDHVFLLLSFFPYVYFHLLFTERRIAIGTGNKAYLRAVGLNKTPRGGRGGGKGESTADVAIMRARGAAGGSVRAKARAVSAGVLSNRTFCFSTKK